MTHLRHGEGSDALRSHQDAIHVIQAQLGQIRSAVSGLIDEDAVASRLGVIEARLRDLTACAHDLEEAADRAHGLGMPAVPE